MELLKTGALERYRRRDLPALIDLYEGNYLRAMRLLPDLDNLEGTLVSRVAGALDLYATIEERFKYTTTVLLTYRFVDELTAKNVRLNLFRQIVEVISLFE